MTEPVQAPNASEATQEAHPSRSERLKKDRRRRRPLLGVIVAVVIVAVGATVWVAWTMIGPVSGTVPQRLVLIGESSLEDGTTVAGLVAVLDKGTGTVVVTPLDSAAPHAIPGTSYDRIRDALPMGGPDLVAQTVADEDAGWLLLDEASWQALIDDAGGVELTVPEATTVFTGEKLFRFTAGKQRFGGADSGALLLGTEGLKKADQASLIRMSLGRALAEALMANPGVVLERVGSDGRESDSGVTSSLEFDLLRTFLSK